MILSVSRRTDIPNYYSDWFFNRLKEGHAYVRNPMNVRQISEVALTRDIVDFIMFWTKNPQQMMDKLHQLEGYQYGFQFTITGYGRDIEPGVPNKKEVIIPTFQTLAKKIGRERMIWRYDPILIGGAYTASYHKKAFEQIAESLSGCTNKVMISFIDIYGKTKRNMNGFPLVNISQDDMFDMLGHMAAISQKCGFKLETCLEEFDLSSLRIFNGSCIEQKMIEEILGYQLKGKQDKTQRTGCSCIQSVDIGCYDSCLNGCRYCYANFSDGRVAAKVAAYDSHSPLLLGTVAEGDKITKRQVKSLKVIS